MSSSCFPPLCLPFNHKRKYNNNNEEEEESTVVVVGKEQPCLFPKSIISLIGRKGCGKTVMIHSASTDSWMDHPRRRELLRPALIIEVIKLARLVIAKAILKQYIFESDIIIQNVQEIMRPLHPQQVNLEVLILLQELQVFHSIFNKLPEIEYDEGFMNAKEVLTNQFPYRLFIEENNFEDKTSLIPTKLELQFCRPPTITLCEMEYNNIKIIDYPGIRPLEDRQLFHEYALEFPTCTTILYCIGLHQIYFNNQGEINLFQRAYKIACEQKMKKFGIVFTQFDVFYQKSNENQQVLVAFSQIRNKICKELIQSLQEQEEEKIPISISICCGLNLKSSQTIFEEMANNNKIEIKKKNQDIEYFIDVGVCPHTDLELSSLLGNQIYWNRSVHGKNPNFNLEDKRKMLLIHWKSDYFHLLNKIDKAIVLSYFSCVSKKEFKGNELPSSLHHFILSYIIQIF